MATPPIAPTPARDTDPRGGVPDVAPRRRKPRSRLTGADRIVVALMVIVPLALVLWLVWFPAISSVVLSFTRWNGIGGLDSIEWIGWKNFTDIFTIYPPFIPAITNNLIWVIVLFAIPTPFGMFVAILLDREMRGSRFYQTAMYMPVVLSLALTGFIWQLIYSRDQGLLNAVLGTQVDWFGDQNVNLWAVLVAASWKHAGYIMVLYLAGLKAVDPGLREAAAIDGASATRTFFQVIFPVLRPINIIVLVITVIESLRAFDLVWIINKGRNGLELISTLVTSNIIGEASRIGFGSALATIMLVISTVFIIGYVYTVMREEKSR